MRKLVILLSAGTLVGLIAGCGSSGTTSTGASTKASTGSTARSAGAGIAGPAPAPAAAAPDVQPADASAALGRDVVRTGTLTLQTTDVPGTIARATATVRAAAGYVESEQAAIDPKDHRQDNALLTLKHRDRRTTRCCRR
jgi:hypothetical protein